MDGPTERVTTLEFEVLIAGAGPAGLSAALILGRCHRKVLICGEERQRNRSSEAIHGLLGHDGSPPGEYLAAAERELAAYPSLVRRSTKVTGLRRSGPVFEFACEDGTNGKARKIFSRRALSMYWPRAFPASRHFTDSVHHCLYCDGFEYKDQTVVAYGMGDKGAGLGLMMKHWISGIIVCTDGDKLSADAAEKLASHNISVRAEPVASLVGENGHLKQILFAQGPPIECDAMFFATGCRQASDLSQRLGCARDDKGGVITDPVTVETSVPGVYVAGDVSREVLLVAIAVAEGAKAAVAINRSFLRSEGLCD